MSGRATWYRESGELVVGYRKTARRQRKPADDRNKPWLRISFELPPAVGFALPVGSYPGVAGVKIGKGGHVEVIGKNRRWVKEQCEKFLRAIAPAGLVRPLNVVQRLDPDLSGPSLSAPIRPGTEKVLTLVFDGGRVMEITGSAMRPFVGS